MFYVYRIINTINDKTFIGISTEPKKRMSQLMSGHGSRLIAKDIEKYGSKVFIRNIVDASKDRAEATKMLQTLILRKNALHPNGYNLSLGGYGSKGTMWNMEQRQKVSGDKNGRSKLAEADVTAIFWDSRIYKEIAKEYNISSTMVSKIKRGKIWKHLTSSFTDE